MRHKYSFKSWVQVSTHDRDIGKIKRLIINSENNAVISGAEDGTIFVYKIDMAGVKSIARGDFLSEFNYPALTNGINEGTFSDEIELKDNKEDDILDDKIYSIQ